MTEQYSTHDELPLFRKATNNAAAKVEKREVPKVTPDKVLAFIRQLQPMGRVVNIDWLRRNYDTRVETVKCVATNQYGYVIDSLDGSYVLRAMPPDDWVKAPSSMARKYLNTPHWRQKSAERKMAELKVGDDVEVLDAGLAMLRNLCPDQPPNHHGRIAEINGDTITVEFPIDGSYDGHSQVAPYPRSEVRKR